jgi:diguanylate cyclase (GGDEF)-like protein
LVKVYLQEPNDPIRKTYKSLAPGDRSVLLSEDRFDVRTRPWFVFALQSEHAVWSKIYNDYTSQEPIISLSKKVFDKEHKVVGVVATDVALKILSDFLKTIQLSANGVAYIVDDDGYIIASSGSESVVRKIDGKIVRLHANEMRTHFISEVYQQKNSWQHHQKNTNQAARTYGVNTKDGAVEVAVAMIENLQGLHWTTIVAIPRSDFMKDIDSAFFQSALIAAAFIVLALVIGLIILDRVMRDIVKLTSAAKRFGDGEPLRDLNIRRGDEIGILAQTFLEMENKLRFDQLTQVANRESLFSQLAYLQKIAKKNPENFPGFTILFVDLDRFKIINDTFGHDTGDQVLVIIASRLQAAVRETDAVTRYGGDEFVLLLKETKSLVAIHQIVEKICILIEQPIVVNGILLNVGLSIGWACCPEDGDDYLALIKIADGRMYTRKRDRKSV